MTFQELIRVWSKDPDQTKNHKGSLVKGCSPWNWLHDKALTITFRNVWNRLTLFTQSRLA